MKLAGTPDLVIVFAVAVFDSLADMSALVFVCECNLGLHPTLDHTSGYVRSCMCLAVHNRKTNNMIDHSSV